MKKTDYAYLNVEAYKVHRDAPECRANVVCECGADAPLSETLIRSMAIPAGEPAVKRAVEFLESLPAPGEATKPCMLTARGLKCLHCDWKGCENGAISKEISFFDSVSLCPICDEECTHLPIDEIKFNEDEVLCDCTNEPPAPRRMYNPAAQGKIDPPPKERRRSLLKRTGLPSQLSLIERHQQAVNNALKDGE